MIQFDGFKKTSTFLLLVAILLHSSGSVQAKQKRFIGQEDRLNFLVSAIQKQVSPCYEVPNGIPIRDGLQIDIEVLLTRQGQLKVPPKLLNPRSDRSYNELADAAIKAIETCVPYKLPPQSYDGDYGWSALILHFIPHELKESTK